MSDTQAKATPRWGRILFKVSGEAFGGEASYGIDGEIVQRLANDIRTTSSRSCPARCSARTTCTSVLRHDTHRRWPVWSPRSVRVR